MYLGDYRIEIIPDTEFRLDGGAMFGVVPRVLWERVCPPDELNRVLLNMNCLFVETPEERILIETGIGEKWSEKEMSIYGISREKPFAESLFDITGCRTDDITIVVNTHLHFDHAGGNTILRSGGHDEGPVKEGSSRGTMSIPQFKNARYFVSKSEFEHAQSPHEREKASYRSENWEPLALSGQLELKPDRYKVVNGLLIEQVRGHSETMQTVKLTRGGETLYGFYDLIPTRQHLALPWIMSYDLFPAETLEFKKRVLPIAQRDNWICLFYHDPIMPLARLASAKSGFEAVKL